MKNWITVFLIFALPVAIYAFFDARAQEGKMCKVEGNKAEIAKAKIIKFSSPMCSECVETAREMKKALLQYPDAVLVEEINVIETGRNEKDNKKAIKKYDISLVPTLIFLDKDGNVVKKQEGLMKSEEIIEVINEIK